MNPAAMFGTDLAPDAPVDDPLDLLDRWLAPAADGHAPIDSTTTPLMALATVGTDGAPRVRHVLLSTYDRGRLHFHTDARTSKAAELAADPRAAVTIVWPELPRQLSVSGAVALEAAAEAALAYARRTRYLQLLAWVNDDELAVRGEAERQVAFSEHDARHPTLEPPPTWVGYALVVERIAFWRGGPGGPSQRIACQRTGERWSTERLPG